MRDVIAYILILLVLAGVIAAWRHSMALRRRDRQSVRFRLVSGSNDRGNGG